MRSATLEDLYRHRNGLRGLLIVSCTLWFQPSYAEGMGEVLNDPVEVGLALDRLDRIDELVQSYVVNGRTAIGAGNLAPDRSGRVLLRE